MNDAPRGIHATDVDVGRRVIYRSAPQYDPDEEGVITSIGRIKNAFVKFGTSHNSQSVDMTDLDWCFPSKTDF